MGVTFVFLSSTYLIKISGDDRTEPTPALNSLTVIVLLKQK